MSWESNVPMVRPGTEKIPICQISKPFLLGKAQIPSLHDPGLRHHAVGPCNRYSCLHQPLRIQSPLHRQRPPPVRFLAHTQIPRHQTLHPRQTTPPYALNNPLNGSRLCHLVGRAGRLPPAQIVDSRRLIDFLLHLTKDSTIQSAPCNDRMHPTSFVNTTSAMSS
ncbi:hypothetical protein CPC08DRAFT_80641 [Agrocybe pediades]|nr:hypothetical protein CPC08DRAFT_80641 [Agrocybe pediades]